MILLLVTAILARLASTVLAVDAWHMDTAWNIVTERLDPVVDPNGLSSHMHKVFGGSGFAAGYSQSRYENAKCSSLGLQADKSAYWAPELYWIDAADNAFVPLPVGFRWYYFLVQSSPNDIIHPFPAGLRYLAGSPNNKAPVSQRKMSFFCLVQNATVGNIAGTDFNFNSDCPKGMQVEIFFPSCWDGINLATTDNSHVTYPVDFDTTGSSCPLTHPVRIPTIMGEWHWHPERYAPGVPMKGNLAWANGDTTGYGFHSDFANGWDLDVLQAGLNDPHCRNLTGAIQDLAISACPSFIPYYQPAAGQACTTPDIGEMPDTYGTDDLVPIPSLPGCNPLWGATGPKPTCGPMTNPDPSPYFTEMDPMVTNNPMNFVLPTKPGWNWIACLNDKSAFSNTTGYSDAAMTRSSCQQSCSKAGLQYSAIGQVAGSSFQCVCASSLDLSRAAIAPGMCSLGCPGNKTESCGGPARLDVFYAPAGTGLLPETPVNGNSSYIGCYNMQQTGPGYLSSAATYSFTSNSMTTEVCLAACNSRGSNWAMTSSSGNCQCGSDFTYGPSTFLPDSFCTAKCYGNSSEICGGLYQGSLYNITSSTLAVKSGPHQNGWQGCYADKSGSLALSGTAWNSNNMTQEVCVNGCSETGFAYAGVKAGKACYCGQSWNGGQDLPASQCNTPCGGNSSETCGAASAYDVFLTNQTSTTPASATALRGQNYLGCFVDSGSTTVLNDYSYSAATMTRDICLGACQSFGYKYGGLEAGRLCKCGNTAPTTMQMPSTGFCGSACAGNGTQTCGGVGYLETYKVSTPSASNSSGAQGDYVGCYSNNSPGLNSYSISSTILTTDKCRTSCKQFGYALAAIQGNTCYCGNSWSGGQVLPSTSCNTPCTSDNTQTCGGSSAASVWKVTNATALPYHQDGWKGCYSDPSGGRGLTNYYYTSTYMTTRACRLTCKGLNYTLAGVEGGSACFCGNALASGSVVQPGPLCAAPCAGNSSESCGATAYKFDLFDATTVPAAASSSSPPPGNSTSLGSSPAGSIGGGSGYTISSTHCYSDWNKLNGASYTSDWLSPSICNQYCAAQGFAYAGIRLGNQCMCGNSGPLNVLPLAVCNTTCTADSTQKCGSSTGYASVYALSNSTAVDSAYVLSPDQSGSLGCFMDSARNIMEMTAYSSTTMSQASCAQNCQGIGYVYAGLEFGNTCYCSNSLRISPTNYQVSASQCATKCSSGTGTCGGSYRMQVFVASKVPSVSGGSVTPAVEGLKGCYLPGSMLTSAPFSYNDARMMTTDVCRRTCRIKGYSIAGLTNSNTCYCSNTANYGSIQVPASCTAACSGNSTQVCGTLYNKFVSIYSTSGAGAQQPSGYSSDNVGCYQDPSSTKILNDYSYASAGMTPSLCLKQCVAQGYPVAGLEAGKMCYCGQSLPSTGIVPDSQCAVSCAGVPSWTCGGVYSMQVYITSLYKGTIGGTPSSANTTVSVATSASATSKVSSLVTSAPSASKNVSLSASIIPSKTTTSIVSAITNVSTARSNSAIGTSSPISSGSAISSAIQSTKSSLTSVSSLTKASIGVTVSSTSSLSLSTKPSATSLAIPASSTIVTGSSTASSKAISSSSVQGSSINSLSSSLTSSTKSIPASSGTVSSTTSTAVKSLTPISSTGKSTTLEPVKSTASMSSLVTSTIATSVKSSTTPSTSIIASTTSTALKSQTPISSAVSVTSVRSSSAASASSTIVPSASASAASVASNIGLNIQGCYSGPISTFSAYNMTCDSLTPTMCQVWCKANSFTYSGVSKGSYCGCSNALTDLVAQPAASCSSACIGDSKQTCGGNSGIFGILRTTAPTRRSTNFVHKKRPHKDNGYRRIRKSAQTLE